MSELTLELAEHAVRAAQKRARELGTPMTVSVVDEGGRLVLCARADGTGFFTPETSRAKAVAAAAFRRSTTELAELAAKGSAFWKTVPVVLEGQALPTPGATPLKRGLAVPLPAIVPSTCVPCPKRSMNGPSGVFKKSLPQASLPVRSTCGLGPPIAAPLSMMPTGIGAPLKRVTPYEMLPGRIRSASMSGVLWSCPGGFTPIRSMNSTKSSASRRSMTGSVATAL